LSSFWLTNPCHSIEIVPLWAILTLQAIQIEIFGQVASNTLISIPKGRLLATATSPCLLIVLFIAGARNTTVGPTVVVLVALTRNTLLAVIVGIIFRTSSALLDLKVIYLANRTRETLFPVEIEVVGQEARHTDLAVPEIVILTFTGQISLIVGLPQGTSLTGATLDIEISGSHTSCAFCAVEVGVVNWAIDALL
jgi:uncharacterized membrane protein YraQ (UPF0718 family)